MFRWALRQVQYLIGFPFTAPPIDLSSAKKLKEVTFLKYTWGLSGVAGTLDSIESGHDLERVILRLPFDPNVINNPDSWIDAARRSKIRYLDQALVRLRDSYPRVCVKLVWELGLKGVTWNRLNDFFERLMPKVMKGDIKLDLGVTRPLEDD